MPSAKTSEDTQFKSNYVYGYVSDKNDTEIIGLART